MNRFWHFAVLIVSLFAFTASKTLDSDKIILANGLVLDIETGKWNRLNVFMSNGVIERLGQGTEDGYQIVDVKNKYLIPGLVDGHVHYFQSGGLYTRPDVADLRQYTSYQEEKDWIKENLQDIQKRYLACGITSTIDVGGPFTNFDIRKNAINNPHSPKAFVAGPLISTYQPDALGHDDPPIIKVKTLEEAQELVWKQAKFKPDFIKIWYIVSKEEPAEKNYHIVEGVGKLCKELNIPFAVHATQLETAKLAIKAGANLLVHSVSDEYVDKEFIKLMKKNDVSYIPTLQVYENYSRTFSQDFDWTSHEYRWSNSEMMNSLFDLKKIPKPQLSTRLKLLTGQKYLKSKRDTVMMENLKKLHKAGINVVAGTDAGNIGSHHGSSLLRELLMMKSTGLSNLDVLKTATVNASKIGSQLAEIGKVTSGSPADIVILSQDPLKDLKALERIYKVVNKGHVLSPTDMFPTTPWQLAQDQLIGYNNRDIDAFLVPYAENIEAYSLNGELLFKGKDNMKKRYSKFFENTPRLHCELVNRMVLGNKVIDQENVTGVGETNSIRAIAIYTIEKDKIVRVDFIRE